MAQGVFISHHFYLCTRPTQLPSISNVNTPHTVNAPHSSAHLRKRFKPRNSGEESLCATGASLERCHLRGKLCTSYYFPEQTRLSFFLRDISWNPCLVFYLLSRSRTKTRNHSSCSLLLLQRGSITQYGLGNGVRTIDPYPAILGFKSYRCTLLLRICSKGLSLCIHCLPPCHISSNPVYLKTVAVCIV